MKKVSGCSVQDELGGGRSLEAGITTRGLPGKTGGRWDGDIGNEVVFKEEDTTW